MIQAIAAAVIWGLVLCLLPGVRGRSDHSIVVAAVTIASSLTLNIDSVYDVGDAILGGRNVLDLSSNMLMVVGIYFLSRAILRAADPSELPATPDRFGLAVLGLVVVGLIVSFSFIEAPQSSTRFMADYGGQWSAAIYSAVQFVYMGVVVGVTGYTCFRFRGDMTRPYFRIAFTLIGVGCALAVVLVLAVLGMDLFHLLGDLGSMRELSVVYDGAVLGAMIFLCAGLALPPVARRLTRRADAQTESLLVSGLMPIWEKTTGTRTELRLESGVNLADQGDSARWRLHRMLVETQDALLVDPPLAKLLSSHEFQVLAQAEDYLAVRQRAGPHGRQLWDIEGRATLRGRNSRRASRNATSQTRSQAQPPA
ncbi:hypothetical protein AU252_01800 [Pseudarthrobacter sulfonivorans]|uniref:Histidine kinase N-terminal 7TM region domain-containing protein n=1 Tax=Pseudarthrobacter sulfonivorans TaxID=121292 RepID=A0A0U3QID5_9MICC|nr:hypothetical protein [Pseudarthrobacter sulfonivorans]ALV40052.1 hypothetical protein AU252_01800 [Pseudarthrobacter sulfonivorans]